MTDQTGPEQPPAPSEMERLRDSVDALQTIVNRVREAVGTDTPAPVPAPADALHAALRRVHDLADRIEAGAPWADNLDNVARRIRDAATIPAGPGPVTPEREQLRAVIKALGAAETQLANVRARHREADGYCVTCTEDFGRRHAPWPCPTASALGMAATEATEPEAPWTGPFVSPSFAEGIHRRNAELHDATRPTTDHTTE
ncbi:hypothetical protein [Streptomyces fumanus]|uniref:hypothetical protein n=1 Tax=Streptomyces fumanus TaxID=67302 RepID=UPI00340C50FE